MPQKNRYILVIILIATGLGILGFASPNNLDNRDQALQGLYVIDIFYNGHYILQTEHQDDPASKPPLYNWLAALASLPFGEVNEFTLRLPSVLAGIGLVVLTFLLAYELLGAFAALIASLVLMANFHFIKLVITARTDMLLTFFITLAFYSFYKGYVHKNGRYYILAWVAIALGTLTKGFIAIALPLAIIFIYLAAVKDLAHLKRMWLPISLGFLIWLVLAGGWFLWALKEGRELFWNKIVINEMWERFWGIGHRSGPEYIRPFYYPAGYLIGKFLPWCLFLPAAIRAVFSEPHGLPCSGKTAGSSRQQLLFLFVWFSTFLLFFSISAGKRVDYIFPLYPAAAILVAGLWQELIPSATKWFRTTLYITTLGIPLLFKHNRLIKGFVFLLVLVLFVNLGYVFWGSAEAKTNEGSITKSFCEKTQALIGRQDFYLYNVPNSVYFYMKRNDPALRDGEAEHLLSQGNYLITSKSALNSLAAKDYEIVLESAAIPEKGAYLLLKPAH